MGKEVPASCPGVAPWLPAGSVSSPEPRAQVGGGVGGLVSSVPVREYHGVSYVAAPHVEACCPCLCWWLWCFWVFLCYSEALIRIRASFHTMLSVFL